MPPHARRYGSSGPSGERPIARDDRELHEQFVLHFDGAAGDADWGDAEIALPDADAADICVGGARDVEGQRVGAAVQPQFAGERPVSEPARWIAVDANAISV